MYYRVTLIIKDKSIRDVEDLFDELYGKTINKGRIVEVEDAEDAEDYDPGDDENVSSFPEDDDE
ncbi:Uncharacterised protein [uncultured archaeon]|nr:Uncharacterised protein [uncultured archaeon]